MSGKRSVTGRRKRRSRRVARGTGGSDDHRGYSRHGGAHAQRLRCLDHDRHCVVDRWRRADRQRIQCGLVRRGTLAFLGGILTFVAGVVSSSGPASGGELTLALGIYLLVDGVSGTILAFRVRPEKGWVGCFLAVPWACCWGSCCSRRPVSGLWAVGMWWGQHALRRFLHHFHRLGRPGVAKRLS